jgi:hypothetical protein
MPHSDKLAGNEIDSLVNKKLLLATRRYRFPTAPMWLLFSPLGGNEVAAIERHLANGGFEEKKNGTCLSVGSSDTRVLNGAKAFTPVVAAPNAQRTVSFINSRVDWERVSGIVVCRQGFSPANQFLC